LRRDDDRECWISTNLERDNSTRSLFRSIGSTAWGQTRSIAAVIYSKRWSLPLRSIYPRNSNINAGLLALERTTSIAT